MGFCNGADENFQRHFVSNIGYCIAEDCITNSLKSNHNKHDIFYDEMVLIFFMNAITKLRVKRLFVAFSATFR